MNPRSNLPAPPTAGDWLEYLQDASERSLLLWDTLRQRADTLLTHEQAGSPPLLEFDYEILMDGAELEIPVSYSLLRILPGEDQRIDETRAPVILIDPRGGHGPGVAGFQQDSQIGESLRAGHPTYFIAFGYSPTPSQTLSDAATAQIRFIELVTARHPQAGKPVIIANCQAGWALIGLACARPELPGLIILNGSPLTYRVGKGRSSMSYTSGLLGGSWITQLGSDLGNGRFDGAWMVNNYENHNPSEAFWTKPYRLFANIDSETTRFLDAERWWGSPSLFNAREIDAIFDGLFIGSRLIGTEGSGADLLDLRAIEAPIVVFCSDGDTITPPRQALGWIGDLYPDDRALQTAGRTIVYLKHASIDHLGIFVSAEISRREHRQMIDAIDDIKALPPGLHELIIDEAPDGDAAEYRAHFEPRSIANIRALDTDDQDEDPEFIAAARVSELTSHFYGSMIRPWLSQAMSEPMAETLRQTHPFRLRRRVWASHNPFLWWLPAAAERTRRTRHSARPDNPLLAWQELTSRHIANALKSWGEVCDANDKLVFHTLYGYLSLLSGAAPASSPKRHDDTP
ncbi:DUF3141 domain-containing protein [Pistricoccus aurantiacus]|uniref:DUF3141 domain-containing protein n=1 Tax=Pistricoccus aurantiacus TaxID=1883414 RepID=UPI00362536B2